MNIIFGGISGLAHTISLRKKEPDSSVRQRMNLPENDMCVHDFNCALEDHILLQGNMYVFNTAVCFHSVFNKRSIVGNEDTLIVIPFTQIILLEKKKKLALFDNSIQITTVSNTYFFTSFVKRDRSFDIITEYMVAFKNLLPKPSVVSFSPIE